MTEEEKKIAEDEIAAGPEGNRPTQSTTSVANQGSGTSEVPFPVDKSQNYPSTESTGSVPRQKFSKEFLEENPDLKVAFAQSEMQRRGVTPTTGATGGATPTTNGAENPDNYTFTESELQAMEQQQTPQGGVIGDGVSSTHLYNYSDPGTSIDKILADPGNENSTNAILNDYFRWCQETGTPIDYFTVNAAIHNKDISKSPADNAKEEKRQRNKEKWDKVGNFLLHLGNVVGNVAGGGMGSVKLEDPVQWSERQRMLKERTEQLRNSYNQSILAQMTKQNADLRQAEMAKKRLEEQAAYRKAMADAAAKKADSSSQVNEAKIKWYNAKTGQIEELTPEQIKEIQSRIERNQKQGDAYTMKGKASLIKANNPGGGSGGSKGSDGKSGKGSNTDLVNVSERYDRKGKLRGVTRTYKEKKGEKKSTGINWVSKNKK